MQQQKVQKCFDSGREYRSGMTTPAWSLANSGLQLTRGIHGGHCTDTTQPCSAGIGTAYMTPATMIGKIKALTPGQWLSIQSYVFVTGTNPTYATNGNRWDCTSANPARHWTNDVERYCWVEHQAILAAIPAGPGQRTRCGGRDLGHATAAALSRRELCGQDPEEPASPT